MLKCKLVVMVCQGPAASFKIWRGKVHFCGEKCFFIICLKQSFRAQQILVGSKIGGGLSPNVPRGCGYRTGVSYL